MTDADGPTPDVAEDFPVEWLPLDELKPFPGNPRQNLEVDDLVVSLKANGWERALVVWRACGDDLPEGVEEGDVLIVAGHRTAAAARELGLGRAPCHDGGFPDLDHARAYNVLDNRSSELGMWAPEELRASLTELPADLRGLTGFRPVEVELLEAGVSVLEIGVGRSEEELKGLVPVDFVGEIGRELGEPEDEFVDVVFRMTHDELGRLNDVLAMTELPNKTDAIMGIIDDYATNRPRRATG